MFQYDELIEAGFTGFKTVKQMNNGGLSSVTKFGKRPFANLRD